MPKINIETYQGREHAYVKHFLLEKYLAPLAFKVGSAWPTIVYVDAFSGPWQTRDANYADSSFGVAIRVLREAYAALRGRGVSVSIQAILVEQDRTAFAQLEAYAASRSIPGFNVCAFCGEFVETIPNIEKLLTEKCPNPFRFVFLDPKGWADIPMQKLQPFLKDRSCEVLVNLMTSHIIRFLDEHDRAESYNSLFGRRGVLQELQKLPKGNNERADQAVWEYCRSLRQLCEFRYVSSAVILDPNEEAVKYFLVYGTNDATGIEVFKRAEIAAARIQDDIHHETQVRRTGQPMLSFDDAPPKGRAVVQLRERYTRLARQKVLELLRSRDEPRGVPYWEVFCEAMSYPLVTPEDLIHWIGELSPHIEMLLSGGSQRRRPSPKEDDRVVVRNQTRLSGLMLQT